MNRRLFVLRGSMGAAALALFGVTKSFAAQPAIPAQNFEQGVLEFGVWKPAAKRSFVRNGESLEIVEVNKFGIWFVPAEDNSIVLFQPNVMNCDSGTYELVRRGNTFTTVTQQAELIS